MNQREKSKVFANAIDDSLHWLAFAKTHLDEPDDDCPSAIKNAIAVLQEAIDMCDSV